MLLAGCATSSGSSPAEELAETLADARLGEPLDRVCFSRAIDGFRDNRERTVVVRRGVSDDYLLVLRSCPQLDSAQLIALTDRLGSGCLRRNDRIIVSESPTALRGIGQIGSPVCFVDSIYGWNENAAGVEDPAASDSDDGAGA